MNYIMKLNLVCVSVEADSQLCDTDSVPSTFRTFCLHHYFQTDIKSD